MLYLHKSLCDLNKAGELATSADPESKAGEQRGGKYYHRIQTGYSKDNSPSYRYFKTQDEWESYIKKQSKSRKPNSENKDKVSLEDKVKKEQKNTDKKKTSSSLFISNKKKKVAKSLFIEVKGNE